jgi:hypothetical protein
MLKKLIFAGLVSFSALSAQLEVEYEIKNMLKRNDFGSIEAKIKDAAENKNLLNQQFEEFCRQFGKAISPDNFEQAFNCFNLFLKLGAMPNSGRRGQHEYDYDLEPIISVINHMNWIFKQEKDLLYTSDDYHADPFSRADPIRTIVADSSYRSEIIDQTCRLITLLVTAGADPNYGENYDDFEDGISPLSYAAAFDAQELIACLLKLGAQANDLNEIYLEIDPRVTDEECIQNRRNEYLKSGINLEELINKYSYTAFCVRYKMLSPTLIALFKYYAKYYESTNEKKKLSYAKKIAALKIRKARCEKIVQLLKEHGADDTLFDGAEMLYDDSTEFKKGTRDYFNHVKGFKKLEILDKEENFGEEYDCCFI